MGILIKDLSTDGVSYQQYLMYIESCKSKLPSAAYDYAKAGWHYDMTDPRCIHDAWLISFKITEALSEKPVRRPDQFDMEASFLNGFHNRILSFSYKNVVHYRLETPFQTQAHSDVFFDEIALSDQGNVVHEILFMSNTRWIIESKEILISHHECSP